MKRRVIGPKMRAVQAYVERNPGRAMMRAARHVGPNGSLQFGYAIVHRAIAARLVYAIRVAGTDRQRLYPVVLP